LETGLITYLILKPIKCKGIPNDEIKPKSLIILKNKAALNQAGYFWKICEN
jgi:hypothetical protein